MAKKGVNHAQVDARRDLVDALDCIGLRPSQILDALLKNPKKNFLDDYDNPIHTVNKDLEHVRAKRKELLKTGQPDETKMEFIAQQKEIFARATGNKDYKAAIEASKNIAKARGLDIDKLTGDFNFRQTIRKIWVKSNGDDE